MIEQNSAKTFGITTISKKVLFIVTLNVIMLSVVAPNKFGGKIPFIEYKNLYQRLL
jgi:hypothetical protein